MRKTEKTVAFGQRLKAAMKNAGMTQYDLAQRLGVQQITVCRWATGATSPSGRAMDALCEIFPSLSPESTTLDARDDALLQAIRALDESDRRAVEAYIYTLTRKANHDTQHSTEHTGQDATAEGTRSDITPRR